MLTLGDVELFLSGAIGGLLSGSIDTALRRLDGQPRAQARAKRRTEALARRVMRDRAIRILAKRGLSVRAIAADLHTGRGTVARALGAGAIGRTRAYEARLRALGYQLRRMTMDDPAHPGRASGTRSGSCGGCGATGRIPRLQAGRAVKLAGTGAAMLTGR